MQIFVNGKPAAIKEGQSFEYVSENRLFSGADAYSMSIVFPLKGCPQNIAIFGQLNLRSASVSSLHFDCEVRCKDFSLFGCLALVQVTDTEIKGQFLEGRSQQNFDKTFEAIYVNELALPPAMQVGAFAFPSQGWLAASHSGIVTLPWLNEATGEVSNNVVYDEPTHRFLYADTREPQCLQYSLLFLTKKICEALGYTYDFADWEADRYWKNIVVCNSAPKGSGISSVATLLPHWSVEEYFHQLELLMVAEFDIDHKAKTVSFVFSKGRIRNIEPVEIANVVDAFEVNVDSSSEAKYAETTLRKYADSDNRLWPFLSCDWFLRSHPYKMYFETLDECWRWYINTDQRGYSKYIFWISEYLCYFMFRSAERSTGTYFAFPQPLNAFGYFQNRMYCVGKDPDFSDAEEIKIVPACVDHIPQLASLAVVLNVEVPESDEQSYSVWHYAEEALLAGAKDSKEELYDKIYIANWDGILDYNNRPAAPKVGEITVYDHDAVVRRAEETLSIDYGEHAYYKPDTSRKYEFRFLSDRIPDVRAAFYIQGKKYVCEKITATFTERGLSQMMKGVFYRTI